MKTIDMRVVGHELIVVKESQESTNDSGARITETVEVDMLKVKLRGIGDDKRTVCTMILDPQDASDYPLGDNGELQFEIRQTRMELSN